MLACGLDPENAIFLQSDVFAHAQLGFLLTSSYMGELVE